MSRNIELEQWLQLKVLRQLFYHFDAMLIGGNLAIELSDEETLVICFFAGPDEDADCLLTLELFVDISDYSASVNIGCMGNSADWAMLYHDDFALVTPGLDPAEIVNVEHVDEFYRQIAVRIVEANLPNADDLNKRLKSCFIDASQVQ